MKKGEVSEFFRRTGSEALCRGEVVHTGKETAPKKDIGVPNASTRPTRPRDALLLTGSETELNLSLG